MPTKGQLTVTEKLRIVAGLIQGLLIKVLATEIKRDTKTLTTFIKNPTSSPGKIRAQEETFLLGLFEKFAEELEYNPSSTSASIFARAGVTPRSRQARNNVLNEMAWNI